MGNTEHTGALLAPAERPAAEVINAAGRSPLILVCEHASSFIPAGLDGLGLKPEDRFSHAVWDIGALAVASQLSARLDAPLVASRVSRMVYDCNRPPEAADAVPARSELILAPGNADLAPAARQARVDEVYMPFRQLLADTIATRMASRPVIVTIHSFTPVYYGVERSVELGILCDSDERLAGAMLAAAPRLTTLKTALNEPYGPADGVTHTLREHALPQGLLNAMIEVRNDLVRDEAGVERVSIDLANLIENGLEATGTVSRPTLNERRQG